MESRTDKGPDQTVITTQHELLCRWAKVIRHDFGNLLYPGSSLLSRVEAESEDGAKLARMVRTMKDMIEELRDVLSRVRTDEWPDDEPSVELSEWWRTIGPLLRSTLHQDVKLLRSAPPRDARLAIPSVSLTNLMLIVFLAVEHARSPDSTPTLGFTIVPDSNGTTMTLETKEGWVGPVPEAPGEAMRTINATGGRCERRETADGWAIEISWPKHDPTQMNGA